ncbi:DUF4870 domain-containing protein [Nodosilinea sp. PGN35]|uniref:DUF4870 domain-containing protein n=1 Tax=Nodosilinea sp. PGN35 TaxID=3020489 RepID=UPI0023B31301|nr:DUF4870 domain-containing protein [Nodosilinea sp. TSF1-S3]MDF0365312.1 DUF4870 domain-containing protein [Nodosilinea sp. TSF1-S3]
MTTPPAALLAQARQGDARAIAHLLTQSLPPGVVAQGQWRGTALHLDLEGNTPISQPQVVSHIRRGLTRLGLLCPLEAVWVSCRPTGCDAVDWQERFTLETSALAPPESPSGSDSAGVGASSADAIADRAKSAVPLTVCSPLPLSPEVMPASRAALPASTLVALVHLVPLASYLAIGSQWLGAWPLLWGSSFLLPWRVVVPLVLLLARGSGSATAEMSVGADAAPQRAFVQRQAKAALNFQLTMLIAWVVTIALMFVLVGFLLVVPLALTEMVSCIVATAQAAEGKPVRYAAAFRFVR